jgi:hypothetical protein
MSGGLSRRSDTFTSFDDVDAKRETISQDHDEALTGNDYRGSLDDCGLHRWRGCRRNQRSNQRGTRDGHSRVQPWPDDIRNTTGVTSKFISIGPAWPDMADKNKSAKRINDLIANGMSRFETLSSRKVKCRRTCAREERSTHRHRSTRIRDLRE